MTGQSDEETPKKRPQTKQQLRQQEQREAWQWVMSTEQGRRVMKEILEYSGFMQCAFNGQTNQTIKNVGMQSVGEYVFTTARATSPDHFLKLLAIEENSNGR